MFVQPFWLAGSRHALGIGERRREERGVDAETRNEALFIRVYVRGW